jgi:hypothetical protein
MAASLKAALIWISLRLQPNMAFFVMAGLVPGVTV